MCSMCGENILTRLQGPQLSVELRKPDEAKAIKTPFVSQLLRDGSLDRAKTQATEMIFIDVRPHTRHRNITRLYTDHSSRGR